MIIVGNEMLRISPKDSKRLEYSPNQGRTWMSRFSGSTMVGSFQDLTDAGNELLATTDKGIIAVR